MNMMDADVLRHPSRWYEIMQDRTCDEMIAFPSETRTRSPEDCISKLRCLIIAHACTFLSQIAMSLTVSGSHCSNSHNQCHDETVRTRENEHDSNHAWKTCINMIQHNRDGILAQPVPSSSSPEEESSFLYDHQVISRIITTIDIAIAKSPHFFKQETHNCSSQTYSAPPPRPGQPSAHRPPSHTRAHKSSRSSPSAPAPTPAAPPATPPPPASSTRSSTDPANATPPTQQPHGDARDSPSILPGTTHRDTPPRPRFPPSHAPRPQPSSPAQTAQTRRYRPPSAAPPCARTPRASTSARRARGRGRRCSRG